MSSTSSYQSLLQQFVSLGGKPELFDTPPTERELRGLVLAMEKLRDLYPQFWDVEKAGMKREKESAEELWGRYSA